MNRDDYRGDYLRSEHWQATRRWALRLSSRCADCGLPGRDVHHLTYRRLGHEHPDDLVVLCRACHDRRHAAPSDDVVTATLDRLIRHPGDLVRPLPPHSCRDHETAADAAIRFALELGIYR